MQVVKTKINREFQQEFTEDLPKISKYLAFYFLNTYQGFTKDLPMIYQRFTKSTKHLPTAYQNIFQFTTDLPTIYQKCLDKNILILLYVFSKKYLATVN